jgi:hypothetical protein
MVERSDISIFSIAARLGAGGYVSCSREADQAWVDFD